MMLKGNGWKVTDLGVDVSSQEFCNFVAKGDIDILGLSVLLTTTMPAVQETIQALQEAGLRDKVKIMVGGAPTTSEWAEKVGADAHASDASDAVFLAEKLLSN
jgi:5-methyltetrahydrofolate--homocysteine methyltransferase